MATTTAKGRYLELARRRDPFLRRARVRRVHHSGDPFLRGIRDRLPRRCSPTPVSERGSWITWSTSWSPPIRPVCRVFRLTVAPEVLLKAGAEATPPDIDRNLVLVEKLINSEIEAEQ